MSPASPVLWLRAAAVATVTVALGVVAHVSAGGLLPHPVYLIVLAAALTSLVAPFLTGPAGYRRLALLLGAGQAAVHAVLTATAGHTAHSHTAAVEGAVGGAGAVTTRPIGAPHLLAVAPAPTGSGGPPGEPHWVSHLVADLSGTNALMSLAHLAAAAGVGFWLWRGEQALWTLMNLLLRRLVAGPETPAFPPARMDRNPPVAHGVQAIAPPCHEISASITRRGPPRTFCVLPDRVATPLP